MSEQCCSAGSEPNKAIIACDGACLKGEIARDAANRLARNPENSATRVCLGHAVTAENSGMLERVINAAKVISVEGCSLKCGTNILKQKLPELQATVVDASKFYNCDHSKYFNVYDLPRDRIDEYSAKVVKHIEQSFL